MKKTLLVIFSIFCSFAAVLQAQDEEQQVFSEAELEQMLAPIALYPDSVLTHILIASTYPLEVVQADRWVTKHPELEPGQAANKVEDKEWDPSVKALVPFPNILERLSDNLDWTQRIGDAFLQSEERVLDAIQSLRRKADTAGNLDKMENMKVSREEKVIVIEPVEREVVYVPYYDTRYIYGNWHWSHYPPVYWRHRHYSYHHHRPYYWYPRVRIHFGFFFNAFHWHNHHIVHIDHHYYNHHRRHYHRRDIIRHNNGRRWHHNPSHRRGVAYRTNLVRDRYHSSRPSQVQTRAAREAERRSRTRTVSDNNAIRANRQGTVNRQTNASRQANNVRQVPASRQQRLRQELRQRQDVMQPGGSVKRANNRTYTDRSGSSSVKRNATTNNSANRQVNQRQVNRDRRDIKRQGSANVKRSENRRYIDKRSNSSSDRRVTQPRQATQPRQVQPRQVQPQQRAPARSRTENPSNYQQPKHNQRQLSSGNRSSSSKNRSSNSRNSSRSNKDRSSSRRSRD